MKLTFAMLTLGTLALCGVVLVSCTTSPPRPAAQYRMPPHGPDEHAAVQAFEAMVRAYGRKDWDGVMDAFADDAQIESMVSGAAGPSAIASPRVLSKHEFGQVLKPIIASNVGYLVEDVTVMTVQPSQVQVSGIVTLLMAGRPSIQHRDRRWLFEKRAERWLVVRAQDL
jgi:hypothetical protein